MALSLNCSQYFVLNYYNYLQHLSLVHWKKTSCAICINITQIAIKSNWKSLRAWCCIAIYIYVSTYTKIIFTNIMITLNNSGAVMPQRKRDKRGEGKRWKRNWDKESANGWGRRKKRQRNWASKEESALYIRQQELFVYRRKWYLLIQKGLK